MTPCLMRRREVEQRGGTDNGSVEGDRGYWEVEIVES